MIKITVADSNPNWIRIQSGQWIRICIRNPDPGGQKWPTEVEKIKEISCFEVLDVLFWELKATYFCSLDVLYGGLGIGKLLIQNKFHFFELWILFNFWAAQNAESGSVSNEYGSATLIKIKVQWARKVYAAAAEK
jgi:hypothetical protein